MYQKHLPDGMPTDWIIAEIDEDNGYLEFLGFNEEFLISVMDQSYDNPRKPYHLCMNQLKGIIGRFDFEKLDWPEWFETSEMAMEAALKLMSWMNENYSNFLPLTLQIMLALGTENQLPMIKRYFEGEFKIHDFNGQTLIFKKLSLLGGSNSYEESAIASLCDFARSFSIGTKELKGGLLTNEKFELIEDLRPQLLNHLNSITYENR